MVATEVRPRGNEWKFSTRNGSGDLQPGLGKREITQPTGLLQEVVQHVQERFIREEWQLAALVQDVRNMEGRGPQLIAIFTHPSRTRLLEDWKPDLKRFIKPELGHTDDSGFLFWSRFEINDPINQILKGTNLYANGILASYNIISVGQEEGFWQTGVGCFEMSFRTSAREISDVDEQIKFHGESLPLQERKEALLALQVPKPKRLFTRA